MAELAPEWISAQQYLRQEATAQERSEYRNGEIRAMSGRSLNHGTLVHTLHGTLINGTEGTPCVSYGSEIKLRIEAADAYYYPDAMVVCEEVAVESETNGVIESNDKSRKFLDYQTVAERYERPHGGDGYKRFAFRVTLPIVAAGLELGLARLYARVRFDEPG